MNEDEKRAHEIALAALPALLINKKQGGTIGIDVYYTYIDA